MANSTEKLTRYGSSECVRGTNASITMTYDSTENAYKLEGSGNYHAIIPITLLNDLDNYIIEADFKMVYNNTYNSIGFYLDNRNNTTSTGQQVAIRPVSIMNVYQFTLSYDVSRESYLTSEPVTLGSWYRLSFQVEGSSLTLKMFDMEGTELCSVNKTLRVDNKQMGLFLACEHGIPNSTGYVKNIKVTRL